MPASVDCKLQRPVPSDAASLARWGLVEARPVLLQGTSTLATIHSVIRTKTRVSRLMHDFATYTSAARSFNLVQHLIGSRRLGTRRQVREFAPRFVVHPILTPPQVQS